MPATDSLTATVQAPPRRPWTTARETFVQLEMPYLVLARALEHRDEQAIWNHYRSCPDQRWCADAIASMAGEMSVTARTGRAGCTVSGANGRRIESHASLIAAPFVLPPQGLRSCPPAPADTALAARMAALWQDWCGAQQRVALLEAPLGYAQVCAWSPLTQSERLATLVGRARPARPRFAFPEASIPQGFPELMFVLGSVQRPFVRPELPDPGGCGLREWTLREQMAANLAYRFERPMHALDLAVPAYFCDAVLAGVRLWLQEVSRRELVSTWRIHPGHCDLCLLELVAADPQGDVCQIPLRTHQLRSDGMDLILTDLHQRYGSPSPSGSVC